MYCSTILNFSLFLNESWDRNSQRRGIFSQSQKEASIGAKVTWYRLVPYLSYSLKRGLGVKKAKEAWKEVLKKNEWLK